MPLQNRVLPTQEIVAHPGRGLMMGNRGCLHDTDRQLGTTRWRSKLWICCVLDWKGVQRDVMPPGRWTALFFMDEATALSAGHRPCAYCRRSAYLDFAERWRRAHGLGDRPKATQMDTVLHGQRVESRTRRQRTRKVRFGDVPDGAMVRYNGEPSLVRGGCVRPWSFDGYGVPIALTRSTEVEVLTPPSTVATLKAGYRPVLHPSATN